MKTLSINQDFSKLTESKLLKMEERIDHENSEVTELLIQAGYGHERSSECCERAKQTQDPLALRAVAAWNARCLMTLEKRARMQYHGSLKPIKSQS